ncbi:hypothetical protein ACFRFU_08980 [Streptomyces sp. NPDC056704]|uniref:hypothetical protein n=1 Tax=Streptomyces sp. NPDC056704 TaxID=3345917 RepID=UPI00367418CC
MRPGALRRSSAASAERVGRVALSVLEALRERGQAAGHGWTLDTALRPPHQQQVNALENPGVLELACLEDRAELSALEGRPVRWEPVRARHPCLRPVPPPGRALAR